MAGVSQGDSVSTVAGEGYSWNSVSADGSGVSLVTGGFSPEDLFFYGEEGVWYDPSDMSTMFQDSAGMTPVTAEGQPVGLILDKSKGLVQQEIIVNGDFSSGTGWTLNNSTISGGALSFSSAPANSTAINSGGATANQQIFDITYTVVSISSGSVRIQLGGIAGTSRASAGTYTQRIASASAGNVVIVAEAAGTTAVIDNVSVKQLLGNHASQTTAAKRPLAALTGICKWTDYDAVDDVLNTTFQSSLGSACTVAIANVGAAPTILTGQTIGTSLAYSTDNAGLVIVNRALTTQETTDLTAYLLAKGATS